ncbi:MAG TPA: methyltransferase domain-containing protein [Bryobacteraceae bacterium]|nr:methyltransferase domain-containing protein [Bryobacteraceae bacterium]
MIDRWDSALYDDRHSFVWKKSADLIDLLDPKPGERILDLGSGTGHLTAQIAERGAAVTGLDSSASMVALARQNFPRLRFQLADARDFRFDEPFDAVFSNAALHWIRDAESVAGSISRALRPGGRFVLEMGVKGNIARLVEGIESTLRDAGYPAGNPWYFPTLGEYSTLIERHGLEVRLAQTFPRWNQLEHPERGLREWLEMFAGFYFDAVPRERREELMVGIEARLRPALWRDGAWWADYRRLRILAKKNDVHDGDSIS